MSLISVPDSRLPVAGSGRVVVTGSVAFDYLMTFPGRFVEHLIPDRMSRLSVSFLVDEMRRVPGGCAPNIAYSLALLGETPLLFATAGRDAGEYRDRLAREGVDVSGLVLHEDVFTASFFVSTDRDQNQIASFYTGAMVRAAQLSIDSLDASSLSLVVISPNDPGAMARYATECRSRRVPFLYDPSQQVARLTGEELKEGMEGAAIVIVNDYEFGILMNKTGLAREEIEARIPALVVTHGSEGSTICVSGRREQVPAAKLETDAVDPTGVGDAFRAGFLTGLSGGLDLRRCAELGSMLATYVIETVGTQEYELGRGRFLQRFTEAYGAEAAAEVEPHLTCPRP
jgi:adenosine kinase